MADLQKIQFMLGDQEIGIVKNMDERRIFFEAYRGMAHYFMSSIVQESGYCPAIILEKGEIRKIIIISYPKLGEVHFKEQN